jgi:hypothetical protein
MGDITAGDGSGGVAYSAPYLGGGGSGGGILAAGGPAGAAAALPSPMAAWTSGLVAPTPSAPRRRGTVALLLGDADGAMRSQFLIACMGLPPGLDKAIGAQRSSCCYGCC